MTQKLHIYNEIENIYHETGGILGHRSMRVFLERKGIKLSKTTVYKYMNQELRLLTYLPEKRPGIQKRSCSQNLHQPCKLGF